MKTNSMIAFFWLFAVAASANSLVDALFDKSRLHDVRISMAAADWATLRAKYQENTNSRRRFHWLELRPRSACIPFIWRGSSAPRRDARWATTSAAFASVSRGASWR